MRLDYWRTRGFKVVDVFPFFNELELLELRLKILSPVVDTFIIVECNRTFSGNPKELYFDKNKSTFRRWSNQIIHYIIADPINNLRDLRARTRHDDDVEQWIAIKTLTSPLAKGKFHWKQEFFQRESIRKALPSLSPNDIVFFSDLDEIWNPRISFNWPSDHVFRLDQTVYPYWMNNKSSEKWTSAFFTTYANILNQSLNELRANSVELSTTTLLNGGWHFSYQGGVDRVRYKLESFSHQELNKWWIRSRIKNRLAANKDALGREFEFSKSEDGLPPEVLAMKTTHPEWFLK